MVRGTHAHLDDVTAVVPKSTALRSADPYRNSLSIPRQSPIALGVFSFKGSASGNHRGLSF